MCPESATSAAWLDTLTIEPPLPMRIIDCEAYFVTSSAPRALMLMTLSNTAISVSIGVAISPPKPPQLTTPQTSSPSMALRTLSSEARSNGNVRQPVWEASFSRASTERPLAITSAPAERSWRTVAPPIPPLTTSSSFSPTTSATAIWARTAAASCAALRLRQFAPRGSSVYKYPSRRRGRSKAGAIAPSLDSAGRSADPRRGRQARLRLQIAGQACPIRLLRLHRDEQRALNLKTAVDRREAAGFCDFARCGCIRLARAAAAPEAGGH